MRYRRADGLEFDVEEGSETQQLMERAGEFERIDEEVDADQTTDTDKETGDTTTATAPRPRTRKATAKK